MCATTLVTATPKGTQPPRPSAELQIGGRDPCEGRAEMGVADEEEEEDGDGGEEEEEEEEAEEEEKEDGEGVDPRKLDGNVAAHR